MRRQLLPGEQVIVVTRPQPRTLIVPAAAFIAVPAVGAFATAWIVKGEPARMFPAVTSAWTFWLVAACILLVVWVLCGYCLPRTLRWQSTRYTLTSQRIVAKYGMLRRREWQVSLAAVRQVWVVQSVLQRILRSGNISLDTGHPDPALLEDVPEAGKFRDFVLEAIDELPPASLALDEGSGGDGLEDVDRNGEGHARQWPWRRREGGRDERWQ